MKTEPKTLKLDQIRIDGGTQPRTCIDDDVVAEYAELYGAGVPLPPVTVFFDGAAYWLADGFHRYWARKRIERDNVLADVQEGTQRDAVLFSVGANSDHGLRRKPGDRKKAVEMLLGDAKWRQWSNCEIGRRCNVSETYVRRIKASHTSNSSKYDSSDSQSPIFVHPKTGKSTTMNSARIGESSKRRGGAAPPIAKGALKPRKLHGEDGPVPMRAISLPLNNPKQAAKSMVGLYGEVYMRQLAVELNQILQSTEGTAHDAAERQE